MKRIKDYIRNNGGTICVLLALVLFLISLILCLSGREKKETVIPTAQPGIIYGYLKLKNEADISIVDADKGMVDQEYKRLSIRAEGILDKKEAVAIPVPLEDLGQYAGKGYFLAFTLVQELIAWNRASTVYFPID